MRVNETEEWEKFKRAVAMWKGDAEAGQYLDTSVDTWLARVRDTHLALVSVMRKPKRVHGLLRLQFRDSGIFLRYSGDLVHHLTTVEAALLAGIVDVSATPDVNGNLTIYACGKEFLVNASDFIPTP